MKNPNFRQILSAVMLSSLMLTATLTKAGPVRISGVRQIVSSNPNRQDFRTPARLVIASNVPSLTGDGDEENQRQTARAQQDNPRVIADETIEVTEEPCACDQEAFIATKGGGFPFWTLGFAAVPIAFLTCCSNEDETPPPTFSPVPPTTPTTPVTTPSVTPSMTPPSSPPEAVPEPMTILLFGTGLSGIGFAARRWKRKRRSTETEENEQE